MPYMKQRDLYMKCNLSIYGPHTFRVWRYSTPYKKINSPYIFNINFIPISYTKAATFIYDLCHFHVPLSYKFRIKTHKNFDIWNSSFFLICFIWIFCVWVDGEVADGVKGLSSKCTFIIFDAFRTKTENYFPCKQTYTRLQKGKLSKRHYLGAGRMVAWWDNRTIHER